MQIVNYKTGGSWSLDFFFKGRLVEFFYWAESKTLSGEMEFREKNKTQISTSLGSSRHHF